MYGEVTQEQKRQLDKNMMIGLIAFREQRGYDAKVPNELKGESDPGEDEEKRKAGLIKSVQSQQEPLLIWAVSEYRHNYMISLPAVHVVL